MTVQEMKSLEAEHDAIFKKVQEVLENKEIMKAILAEYPKELENTAADALRGNEIDYININFQFLFHR